VSSVVIVSVDCSTSTTWLREQVCAPYTAQDIVTECLLRMDPQDARRGTAHADVYAIERTDSVDSFVFAGSETGKITPLSIG
jgi:hypothetical protein